MIVKSTDWTSTYSHTKAVFICLKIMPERYLKQGPQQACRTCLFRPNSYPIQTMNAQLYGSELSVISQHPGILIPYYMHTQVLVLFSNYFVFLSATRMHQLEQEEDRKREEEDEKIGKK
jgi:hypothetical protein